MERPWRRKTLIIALVCCIVLGVVGACAAGQISRSRRGLPPPAELVSLGPVWVGDFCRYNVEHGRHPPGWCPRDYTVYVILNFGSRGAIYRLFSIRDNTPLKPEGAPNQ